MSAKCATRNRPPRIAALRNASHLFDDVVKIQEQWRERVEDLRADAVAHRIVGALLSHPVVDSEMLESKVEAARSTISAALGDLAGRGVLRPIERKGRGPQRYVAQDVVRALDAFTSRSINPFGRH